MTGPFPSNTPIEYVLYNYVWTTGAVTHSDASGDFRTVRNAQGYDIAVAPSTAIAGETRQLQLVSLCPRVGDDSTGRRFRDPASAARLRRRGDPESRGDPVAGAGHWPGLVTSALALAAVARRRSVRPRPPVQHVDHQVHQPLVVSQRIADRDLDARVLLSRRID